MTHEQLLQWRQRHGPSNAWTGTSGMIAAEVYRLTMAGDYEEAAKLIREYETERKGRGE